MDKKMIFYKTKFNSKCLEDSVYKSFQYLKSAKKIAGIRSSWRSALTKCKAITWKTPGCGASTSVWSKAGLISKDLLSCCFPTVVVSPGDDVNATGFLLGVSLWSGSICRSCLKNNQNKLSAQPWERKKEQF